MSIMKNIKIINFKEKNQGYSKLQIAIQQLYLDNDIDNIEDENEIVEMYCPSELSAGNEYRQSKTCYDDCIRCWNKCASKKYIEEFIKENII